MVSFTGFKETKSTAYSVGELREAIASLPNHMLIKTGFDNCIEIQVFENDQSGERVLFITEDDPE